MRRWQAAVRERDAHYKPLLAALQQESALLRQQLQQAEQELAEAKAVRHPATCWGLGTAGVVWLWAERSKLAEGGCEGGGRVPKEGGEGEEPRAR